MAISQDEWNGELTRFLDRLPLRPCIVPPAPSFCTVCGRLNHPVASACKFYPLRFDRELGRTTVESASFMARRDTFEIDIDFEEEEEEPEIPDAPMIEFERRERIPVLPPAPITGLVPANEADVEVVEAELVEVIEEPAEETVIKRIEEGETTQVSQEAGPTEGREIESQIEQKPVREEQPVQPEKMTVIAPIYPQPKLKIIAIEKPPVKTEEMPLPPPPPDYKGPLPAGVIQGEPVMESPPPKAEVQPSAPEALVIPETTPIPPSPESPPSKPEAPQERPEQPAAPELPPVKPETPEPENAPPVAPTPAPAPPTGRRTGGLYDIFRRKPTEPKKDAPAPQKAKSDEKKKEDEELLKRLKSIEK
jgi:hypothetical protein